ncbi:MAG: hypothetical protein AMXMBFR82_20310 [Candidatus Hydrogenedentota bacterium]
MLASLGVFVLAVVLMIPSLNLDGSPRVVFPLIGLQYIFTLLAAVELMRVTGVLGYSILTGIGVLLLTLFPTAIPLLITALILNRQVTQALENHRTANALLPTP